ncbi:hypothetical protein RRG08_008032 [Elysia crispata]|uniref:Uncharacterized protein n=1 Tax=Elysia crispata TaxID=231223 RepID=A0AAE1AHS9_9GAST|nr:hypothetical protein RRG08_008032 [Elysia crispata]
MSTALADLTMDELCDRDRKMNLKGKSTCNTSSDLKPYTTRMFLCQAQKTREGLIRLSRFPSPSSQSVWACASLSEVCLGAISRRLCHCEPRQLYGAIMDLTIPNWLSFCLSGFIHSLEGRRKLDRERSDFDVCTGRLSRVRVKARPSEHAGSVSLHSQFALPTPRIWLMAVIEKCPRIGALEAYWEQRSDGARLFQDNRCLEEVTEEDFLITSPI